MEPTQEAANLANIKTARYTVWILGLTALLVVVAVVTLYFVAYPPSQTASAIPGGQLALKDWLVIILSSSIVLASAALIFASLRLWKGKRVRDALATAQNTIQKLTNEAQVRADLENQPSVEILSPFSNDEVGLYETVRGRVVPGDCHLQVFVFAGDNKWYAQRQVAVSGTSWSVQCQFGSADTPSAGVYKIAAVLDSHLSEGVWYDDLPNGVRSNVVTVHRPEITIEHKLDEAKREWREWERKYHKVNNEKIPVETERDNYKNQLVELKNEITSLNNDLEAANRQSQKTQAELTANRRLLSNMTEKRDDAIASVDELKTQLQQAEESHNLVLTTERIEKNMLKDDLERVKHEAGEANKRANEESGNKESIYAMFQEKERRLVELDWLMQLAENQLPLLSDYVNVEIVTDPQCGELQLTGNDLCVLLVVWITNQSVFEIAIEEKKISGQFSLNRVAFKEKAEQLIDDFRAPLHNLKPRQREYIIIEQPLRTFEAEKITKCLDDPNAKFRVGAVQIPISINNPGFELKNKPTLLWGQAAEVSLKYFKRNTDNG